ncbi:metallophosphoesterase [Myxococcota bacterium]|nr:metallophosphoesterase [Myxococcota bacterium]
MPIPRLQLVIFLGVLMTLASGVTGWLAWRLVGVLDLPAPWHGLGLAAVVGWMGLVLAGMVLPRLLGKGPGSDALARVAFANLGLLSFVLTGVVLRDLAWLSWDFFSGIPALAAGAGAAGLDQALRASTVAIVGGSLGLVALGWRNARVTPAVRTVEVPLPGLPAALDGFTIAQLSDVHVGPTIEADWLSPVVLRVNDLRADLVVITGDLVDGSVADLARHVAPLATLESRHGTFFVTGNHEYYSGAPQWVAHLATLGVRPLMNEHVLLRHGEGRLLLAGVPDHDAARILPAHAPDVGRALAGAPARDATVLLAHQPRSARLAQGHGVDLQLSGHTHGGQLWPWMHLVWLQQPMVAGLQKLGDLLVYTSRGTGYWGPPVRIGAPSEISRLVLRSAPARG